jgi:glycerol kinase
LSHLTTAQLRQYLPEHVTFTPDMARHARLQARWQAWQQAVALARQ